MIKEIYGVDQNGEKVRLNFNELRLVSDTGCEIAVQTKSGHPDNLDLYLQIMSDDTREEVRYFNMIPGACNVVMLKTLARPAKSLSCEMKGD